MAAAYPVPAGSSILGATIYVADYTENANIAATLTNHHFDNGGSYSLANGRTNDTPGPTTITLEPKSPAVVEPGQAINISVDVGNGTCLKGAELHYVPGPVPAAMTSATGDQARGVAPDGSATDGTAPR